jgi:hypothetical protein
VANTIEVYLEVGQYKTIASALHWPGWARAGKDQHSALGRLLDYAWEIEDRLD